MNMIRALRLLKRNTTPKALRHELYGTYIVIKSFHTSAQLLAIQEWVKNHPRLTFVDMPYADVKAKAEREGMAYVCIDEKGNVTASISPRSTWREVIPTMEPRVVYYSVKPTTTTINGKAYDNEELEKALATLTPVEK